MTTAETIPTQGNYSIAEETATNPFGRIFRAEHRFLENRVVSLHRAMAQHHHLAHGGD